LWLLLPNFRPSFLIKFSENPKITKKNENPKKYVFNIFASFLAFSTSSKKNFKFSKVFRTRSTFHISFLKSSIFLIESTLILLVFKKYKKIKKNQIYKKKKEVEGPILRPKQHFTYKYRSTTHTKRELAILHNWKNTKNPKNQNPFFSLTKVAAHSPSLPKRSRRPPGCWFPIPTDSAISFPHQNLPLSAKTSPFSPGTRHLPLWTQSLSLTNPHYLVVSHT